MLSPRVLTITLLVLCAATFAEASTGVRVVGDPKLRLLVTQRIATWLVEHEHEVDENAMGQVAQAALDQCYLGNELSCANKVFHANGNSDLYVLVNLEVTGSEGRDRAVRATLWLLKSLGAPEHYEQACDGSLDGLSCDDDQVAEMVDKLAENIGSYNKRAGMLRISSDPAGALVKVDGKSAGATPLDNEQRPGMHHLELSRPGYHSELRKVEVVAGEVIEVVVDLRRRPPSQPRWRKTVMYGAAAAGVLAIAGGIVAISVNEGDHCGTDPKKKECLYSLPHGVAAVVSGTLALGGAGYLWFTRDSVPMASEHATTKRPARGVGVGLSVTF